MIQVLLFSYLQEAYGEGKLSINKDELTVSELKLILQEEFHLPKLDSVMVAINEGFANNEQMIKAGDIVACIPPVSGG